MRWWPLRWMLSLALLPAIAAVTDARRQADRTSSSTPVLPPQAFGVPLVRQQTGYSCGPAALLALLKFFGAWDGSEQQLYPILETSSADGTLPEALATGAAHFGLGASVESDMTIARLRAVLASGRLVILEFQAWRSSEQLATRWRDLWTEGHYAVLIAIDARFAYFMDPSTQGAYAFMPLSGLEERWHDVNPARPVPLEPYDRRLGVIVGSLKRSTPQPALTRRVLPLN